MSGYNNVVKHNGSTTEEKFVFISKNNTFFVPVNVLCFFVLLSPPMDILLVFIFLQDYT